MARLVKRKGRSLDKEMQSKGRRLARRNQPTTTLPKYKKARVDSWVNTYYDLVKVGDHPDHPAYPKVNETQCPAETYYAVDPKFRKPMQAVTVLPDGLCLGWSYCGACSAWWAKCACPNGVTAPRSVEYIFDKHNAVAAGEEWNYLHSNYRGSITRAVRERRMAALDTKGRGGRRIEPRKPSTSAPAGRRKLRKAGTPVQAAEAPRRVLKKTDSSSVLSDKGVDSKALDAAAKDHAADMEQELLRNVGGSTTQPRKRLKKKVK